MPTFVADEIVTATKLNAGTVRDWDDWTPTLGGITLGSGVLVARYQLLGTDTVHVECKFTLGSGSAITGAVTVSTPVTAARDQNGTWGAWLNDSGTAAFLGIVFLSTTDEFTVRRMNVSGSNIIPGNLSSTIPFTWTSGDFFSFTAIYEVA